MEDQIDLSSIIDMDRLKSLDWDQERIIETAQNNRQVIRARMEQVAQLPAPEPDPVHNGRVTKAPAKK